ncbi:Beta-galactosidase [Tenacibaculum sp. MAR_2009_124]|uniref:beta-galactosidase n=1 Tax=Tenacibaculum sp. MAR_2009_124 TaxID=1250059 RepID=UPI00089B5B50|nr:beta-galactosidase [Tenacibaculum sp. MAR_2009_124]SEC78965.1 Beta-galactosidase [Tenacibaculum sp. MAR_2009_124]
MKRITNLILAISFLFLSCSDNYMTKISQIEIREQKSARVENQSCHAIKNYGELKKKQGTWFSLDGNQKSKIENSIRIWDAHGNSRGTHNVVTVFFNESKNITVIHTINNLLYSKENLGGGTICSPGLKPVPAGIALRGVSRPTRGYVTSKQTFYNTPVEKLDISIHQIRWSDLEPTKGNYDFSIIDNALDYIKEVNSSYQYIIRMNCGVWSPEWLKEEVGYVLWDYKKETDDFKLPKFWNTNFLQNYERLMMVLAERYDNHPMVAAVQANALMTFHGEVMWNRLGRPEFTEVNRENLYGGGYTVDKDISAYEEMMRIHDRAWKRTRTLIALNPYKTDGNDSPTDETLTSQLFSSARNILGVKGIVGQHTLFDNVDKEIYQKWLLPHARMGYPIYFQTQVFAEGIEYDLEDLYRGTKVAGENFGVFVELPNKWDCTDIIKGPGGNDCSEHHRANNMQEGRRLLKSNARKF